MILERKRQILKVPKLDYKVLKRILEINNDKFWKIQDQSKHKRDKKIKNKTMPQEKEYKKKRVKQKLKFRKNFQDNLISY